MGRPLNKKYFGNRNIGSTGTGDNYGIGGEGIADVTFADAGSWLATAGGASVPISGLSMPAPTLPGGVQATWDVTYGIQQVTTGAGHTGLIVGETYTSASFPGSIITVATVPAGNATFTVTNQGATGTLPTDLQGVSITLRPGLGYTGAATFLVDIYAHVKGVTINEKGSGYTGAETITVTTANGALGTAPSGIALVLTTDTGAVGSATNQENAMVVYAQTLATGSGGSNLIGDIIKQVSTTRYKVKTSDGTAICKLVTDGVANAAGEMTITATDANGNTYYVSKLTGHKATLVRLVDDGSDNDWVYATGQAAPWSFSAASGTRVQIANA